MANNVLLITIDSFRQDHLSFFGHTHDHTHAINFLIEDGVSFTRAFATGPGTQPSFPAMLTRTYLLSYQGVGKLTANRPRVATNLQSHDLSTGGFRSNPFLSAQFNYHVGFETYRDYQNPLMGVARKMFPRGIEIDNPQLKAIDDALGLTDKLKRAYQLVSGKA